MTPNPPDPILDELHAIRREISSRFGNDVHRIADDARCRQSESGLLIWQGPATPEALATVSPGSRDNGIDAEFKKK